MTASASRNSWVGFSSRRNEFGESTGTSLRLLSRRLERLLLCHARPVRSSTSLRARWRGLLWHLADVPTDPSDVCLGKNRAGNPKDHPLPQHRVNTRTSLNECLRPCRVNNAKNGSPKNGQIRRGGMNLDTPTSPLRASVDVIATIKFGSLGHCTPIPSL